LSWLLLALQVILSGVLFGDANRSVASPRRRSG
jgi:hypothetical protein